MVAMEIWESPDGVSRVLDRKPTCSTCARAVPVGTKDIRCDSEFWIRNGREIPHSKVGCCDGYEERS